MNIKIKIITMVFSLFIVLQVSAGCYDARTQQALAINMINSLTANSTPAQIEAAFQKLQRANTEVTLQCYQF